MIILESLSGKHAEAIAEPEKYPNLFGEYEDSLRAEKFYNEVCLEDCRWNINSKIKNKRIKLPVQSTVRHRWK